MLMEIIMTAIGKKIQLKEQELHASAENFMMVNSI
jgi:hypothetical protein